MEQDVEEGHNTAVLRHLRSRSLPHRVAVEAFDFGPAYYLCCLRAVQLYQPLHFCHLLVVQFRMPVWVDSSRR